MLKILYYIGFSVRSNEAMRNAFWLFSVCRDRGTRIKIEPGLTWRAEAGLMKFLLIVFVVLFVYVTVGVVILGLPPLYSMAGN